MMRPILFASLVFWVGCSAPEPLDCSRSADCASGFCVSGRCVDLDAGPTDAGSVVRYLDVPYSTTDARSPSGPACSDAVSPTAAHLVLNEVLVNVPAGPSGDANGDGVRDPYDDEFVELVSLTDRPVDMSRVQIKSGDRVRFAFGAFCLPPAESVVVFGGGSVGSSMPGNVIVSPDRFAFGNEGGRVAVTGPAGSIGVLDYGRAPPASYTRTPQLVGDRWADHREVGDLPFSPGRCASGTSLASGCPWNDATDDAAADAEAAGDR